VQTKLNNQINNNKNNWSYESYALEALEFMLKNFSKLWHQLWVPAHDKIEANEKVDRQAREIRNGIGLW